MLIDITLPITPAMVQDTISSPNPALAGHLGTHFDVMNRAFPLSYTRRPGMVWDVSIVHGRDIGVQDVDIDQVKAGTFVAFYTGFIEQVGYGGEGYFSQHPQLSDELIDRLLEKGVSIIGVDFAGIRRGSEHTPKDQYCADHGTFVVENLCHLNTLVKAGGRFIAHTYPMPFTELTGLPCRVIAELP